MAHEKKQQLNFFIFGHPCGCVARAPLHAASRAGHTHWAAVPPRPALLRCRSRWPWRVARRMSPSPEIHNVGFAKNGYPHRYERFDTVRRQPVARSSCCLLNATLS
jgi:hypothetical protein